MTILFAFDFDRSFTEEDTGLLIVAPNDKPDRFAFENFGSASLRDKVLSRQKQNQQWTDIVSEFLGKPASSNTLIVECYMEGVPEQFIKSSFKRLKIHPSMKLVLDLARSKSATIMILSDSNKVYIESALEQHGLSTYIDRIITNPAEFVDGCLIVERFVKQDKPHKCPHCPLNLCKGEEMSKLMKCFDHIVYIGDGANDYCPSTRLKDTDTTFLRKGFECDRMISADQSKLQDIRAMIVKWTDADDLLMHVAHILNKYT